MESKIKLEDSRNYLKSTQLENKIINLEKHETQVHSFKTDLKEFIKNNKLIQQRF